MVNTRASSCCHGSATVVAQDSTGLAERHPIQRVRRAIVGAVGGSASGELGACRVTIGANGGRRCVHWSDSSGRSRSDERTGCCGDSGGCCHGGSGGGSAHGIGGGVSLAHSRHVVGGHDAGLGLIVGVDESWCARNKRDYGSLAVGAEGSLAILHDGQVVVRGVVVEAGRVTGCCFFDKVKQKREGVC